MKKLMIAAVIVCTAVISQAAQIDWRYSMDATKSTLAAGDVVYLIAGDTAATSWENAAAVAAAASESLASGYSGTVAKVSRNNAIATTSASSFTSTASKGYFVIVNAAGDKWSSTDVIDFALAGPVDEQGNPTSLIYDPAAQGSSPGMFKLENFATAPSNAFAAVPEPTSGLLLLLGVAGMALRRRRA